MRESSVCQTRVDASEMTRGTNSLHSPDTEDYSTYSVTWTRSPPARDKTATRLADRNSRPRYASSGITEPQPSRSAATKIRVDWTFPLLCTLRARVRVFFAVCCNGRHTSSVGLFEHRQTWLFSTIYGVLHPAPLISSASVLSASDQFPSLVDRWGVPNPIKGCVVLQHSPLKIEPSCYAR